MRREKWYADIGFGVYENKNLKSKYYESVLEQQTLAREKEEKETEDRKRMHEKMNSYSKFVKEMHWPHISKKKQQEIEEIKDELTHRNVRRSLQPAQSAVNISPVHDDLRASEPFHPAQSDLELRKKKKVNWNMENPMIPKPQPKREGYLVDYLGHQRRKRESSSVPRTHAGDWKNVQSISGLNEAQKVYLIKEKARLIEDNAKRKEQMIKITGSPDIRDACEVNDMLIDAIEAKLSLLEDI